MESILRTITELSEPKVRRLQIANNADSKCLLLCLSIVRDESPSFHKDSGSWQPSLIMWYHRLSANPSRSRAMRRLSWVEMSCERSSPN
jgi:hypothetical protein